MQVAQKERPILFSAAMVRALLDGSKTQTRRVLKSNCQEIGERDDGTPWPWSENPETAADHWHACPYGEPGDRLWVRETFLDTLGTGVEHRDQQGKRQRYAFAADCRPGSYGDEARKDYGLKWKPSIHMPRAASRILLEIVSVRVERLQAIGEEDARAEGVTIKERHTVGYCAGAFLPPSIRAYRELWESINGTGSWDANPWVWVVEFKRVLERA
jgi:hypothetical protein